VWRASASEKPITHESEKYADEFQVDYEIRNTAGLSELHAAAMRLPSLLWPTGDEK
jgi:hypothetical protein